MKKIYVTKYALTTGIEEHMARTESTGMAVVLPGQSERFNQYFHGKDWWSDKSDALSHAEHMRVKKIASLEKQIAKLKAMKFV